MPSSRKKQLMLAGAQKSARKPDTERLRAATTPTKGYKVVAVSLYTTELSQMDELKDVLRRAGRRATRSGILHEAIARLYFTLHGKSPQEVLKDFHDHEAKRAPSQ